MKQQLVMALEVQQAGVINGFCYPFARLLLDKLKDEVAKEEPNNDLVEELRSQLQEQFPTLFQSYDFDEEIANANEFLAIFEID